MARTDVKNDITPVNTRKPPSKPTVAALRAALTAYSGTTYSAVKLDGMQKNDMVFAARTHSLTVDGL
jgi:cytoplasmic iron level regulating protein YaaA (DUF328/UPF0246 family)